MPTSADSFDLATGANMPWTEGSKAHQSNPQDSTREERWLLAQDVNISEANASTLAQDPDDAIASALATNYSVSRSVLAELAERRPDLRPLIASNVNAPADIKEELPLRQHVESSLTEYLADQDASPTQRTELRALFLEAIRNGDDQMTLANAWAIVSDGI
ncbi:hypothetical protein [Microbacterium oxydans]|uniref:hypothetical protein n=1 Tax=Microbacterium oxydans TaxID=82380 RepID=UPI00367328FF